MASNPMQRKARISFLLGFLTMTIIAGAVIALLFMMIKNKNDEVKKLQNDRQQVYVLKQPIKSGQIITQADCEIQTVSSAGIPGNAIGPSQGEWFEAESLQDKEGHEIHASIQDGVQKLTITIQNDNKENEYELVKVSDGASGDESISYNYYYEAGGKQNFVELNTVPLVTKIDLEAKTILTSEMVRKGDNSAADDVRIQEYNSVILPTDLETGDYIDIRLALPNGQDYIVVSKKSVTIPDAAGVPIANTIRISTTEMESLYMGNALIDSYLISGSKLYATKYSEAGLQSAATPTYTPNRQVINLLARNPNILDQIKISRGLANNTSEVSQLKSDLANLRQVIDESISNDESATEGVSSKVEESITSSQEARQAYLDGISGTE